MKFKSINWGPAIFLITYQVLLLAFLPFYFYNTPPSLPIILTSIALFYITGISVTGGYHRYYSHRTFKTNRWIEAIMLFFASMSAQGSALRWSFDHRLHHAHVDTDNDPYSISKGFWYAHFLWILEKPRTIDPKVVPDLQQNPLVRFQHRFYPLLMVLTNALVVIFFGWLFQDYWGAFISILWIRLFALHHFTWFINSLAHTWGERPFCQEQSAVNNYILSFLTFGEGYHNYHHTFANDYRNGVRWFHFDPTKWVIWFLAKIGLAHGLKRVDPITIQKRMVLTRKTLLMEKLTTLFHAKKEELEQQVHYLCDQILTKISEFSQLKGNYILAKKEGVENKLRGEIASRMKAIRRSMKVDWKNWQLLSRTILQTSPALEE